VGISLYELLKIDLTSAGSLAGGVGAATVGGAAQASQFGPPQSTSVSPLFCIPSLQVSGIPAAIPLILS